MSAFPDERPVAEQVERMEAVDFGKSHGRKRQLAAPASGYYPREIATLSWLFRVRSQRAQARQSVAGLAH